MVHSLRSTPSVANLFECRADLVCSARSTLVAKRVTSTKIEGMSRVWDARSNEMGYAKREAHGSFGV